MSSSDVAQFVGITGIGDSDARKFLKKYKTVEAAMNAYYDNPNEFGKTHHKSQSSSGPSLTKLNTLFDKYKEPDGDIIAVDGTIQFCEDLKVDPEDVVLLSVAYELKSPRMGEWTKKEWVEGWKALGADNIEAMQTILPTLRKKLASDPDYFKNVYNHTFNFARQEGQRSIGLDVALPYWQLLLPFGLQGGALSHVIEQDDDEGGDVEMSDPDDGFKEEYIDWWFEFLQEKGVKGVSKDTWQMVRQFIRTIDSRFEKHDDEASWPSQIDDFVAYSRDRLAKA